MSSVARALISLASVSARAMMSARTRSASPRAASRVSTDCWSESWIFARYWSRSASASALALSAPSRSSRILSWRSFSVFFSVGNANFTSTPSTMRNASDPQISSGAAGVTMLLAFLQSSTALVRSEVLPLSAVSRHSLSSLLASTDGSALAGWASANNIAPPKSAAASNLRMRMARPSFRSVCAVDRTRPRRGGSNELEDETDEGERLGERDAEEHRRPHVAGHLGLAGHRLHRLADQVTDTDAGADGGEAVTDRTEAGLQGVRLRHRQAHELVHANSPWLLGLGAY